MQKPHGHRVFGVTTPEVQLLIAKTIAATGLEIAHQFTSGATHQIAFTDGTVVNRLDRTVVPDLPSSALSLPAEKPAEAAAEVVKQLHAAGYTDAVQFEPIPNLPKDSFVMVTSAALEGWSIAFRSPEIDKVEEKIGEPAEL